MRTIFQEQELCGYFKDKGSATVSAGKDNFFMNKLLDFDVLIKLK